MTSARGSGTCWFSQIYSRLSPDLVWATNLDSNTSSRAQCIKPNHNDHKHTHTDVFGEHTQSNWVSLFHTFSDHQPLIMMISGFGLRNDLRLELLTLFCGGKGIHHVFQGIWLYWQQLRNKLTSNRHAVWLKSPVMINEQWFSERVRLWRVHRNPVNAHVMITYHLWWIFAVCVITFQ